MSIKVTRRARTVIACKLSCSPDSLRVWMRQIQRNGEPTGQTKVGQARIKELESEVRELRQSNEIVKQAASTCDKVDRLFKADRPNKLWVSGFSYLPPRAGTICVALVPDGFVRRIVGWRASPSVTTPLVLDALDQVISQRKTPDNRSMVHQSDHGSQGLSIKYTERHLAKSILPGTLKTAV